MFLSSRIELLFNQGTDSILVCTIFLTSFPLYSSSLDSPLQLHSFFRGNKLSVETILWNRTTKPHTELPQHLIFFRFNFCPSFDTPSTEPTNKNRLTLRALCKDCLIRRRRRITARNLRDNSFVRFGFFSILLVSLRTSVSTAAPNQVALVHLNFSFHSPPTNIFFHPPRPIRSSCVRTYTV